MTWDELAWVISTMPKWMREQDAEVYLDRSNHIVWGDSNPVAGVTTYYGEDELADAIDDGMNHACLYLSD